MSHRYAPVRPASVVLASVLSCIVAASVYAQPSAPAPKAAEPTVMSSVTIEAAPKPKVIQRQAHTFVESYAASPNAELDQIARWRDSVCVQVEGLPADSGALVKARIEDVAKAVGLPKAHAGCVANVEIVFTDKPQALMDNVAKRRETLLGYYHRHDRDKLKMVTRPIQAWYVTATLGGGGSSAAALYGVDLPLDREVVDDPDNMSPVGCGINPHFSACLQSNFKNVFVVADTKALDGKDLGLLADYLVMLTLSQPRSLNGCNALPSVLDVLATAACAGRDEPDGITPGDAAYLTALYSTDIEAKKASQLSDIAGRMAKILTKASAGGR
jgi:hypothetical protein